MSNQEISQKILSLVKSGMPLEAALDEVLGTGTFKRIAGELYDTIKSEDSWVPACGGAEVPFVSRSGRKLLYCWNRATGKHAYLDCSTDIILTDEEARLAMQMS